MVCEAKVFESFQASRYRNTAVEVNWDICRSIKGSLQIYKGPPNLQSVLFSTLTRD